ncbi:hypothetical protein GGF31_000054 [Allomyces arbusculus]|nr:hypothetical protein GGF31_000054 [Allomyces arbusculus]
MVGLESKYSIHHFQLLEPVGRPGSSGTVFRARTELPDLAAKPLAVKVIPKAKLTTMDAYTRVKNECLVHRQLDHPTIPTLYTAMEDHDHIYLVMELCERGTLQDYLERRTAHCLPESEARWVLQKVAQGLVHLATNGIMHRDLKPANILLTRDNQVKIGDFGLAKSTAAVEAKATDATVCGTLNFMAPEVTHKTGYSAKVDVWALGCLAVTLLTGKPPFDSGPGQVARTLDAIRTAQYRPPEYLSPDARDLITKLLDKNPRRRPTVHQVLEHMFFRPSQIFVPLQPLDDRDGNDRLMASPDHRDAPRYPSSSAHDDRAPHARAPAPSSLQRMPADAGYGNSTVSTHRSLVGHHQMVPPPSAPPSQPQQSPPQYAPADPPPVSYRRSTGYTHPVAPPPSQPIHTDPAPPAPPHGTPPGPPAADPTLLTTEYCRISHLSVKGHTICVLDTGELVIYRDGAPEILAIARDGRWAHIYRAADVFPGSGPVRPDVRNATPVAEFPHTHLVPPWTVMYRLGKKLTEHIRAQSLLVVMDGAHAGFAAGLIKCKAQPMLELTSAEVRLILHPAKDMVFVHPATHDARVAPAWYRLAGVPRSYTAHVHRAQAVWQKCVDLLARHEADSAQAGVTPRFPVHYAWTDVPVAAGWSRTDSAYGASLGNEHHHYQPTRSGAPPSSRASSIASASAPRRGSRARSPSVTPRSGTGTGRNEFTPTHPDGPMLAPPPAPTAAGGSIGHHRASVASSSTRSRAHPNAASARPSYDRGSVVSTTSSRNRVPDPAVTTMFLPEHGWLRWSRGGVYTLSAHDGCAITLVPGRQCIEFSEYDPAAAMHGAGGVSGGAVRTVAYALDRRVIPPHVRERMIVLRHAIELFKLLNAHAREAREGENGRRVG